MYIFCALSNALAPVVWFAGNVKLWSDCRITNLPEFDFEAKEIVEAVSKILAEQDEDAAEVDEAEVVGGMIFIADHQPPEVA